MTDSACVFCEIVAKRAPATIVREWEDAIAIVPLNPVTAGHVLVLPKAHVQTFFSDPDVSATTMRRAAEMLHGVERHHEPRDHNVITSAGRAATQTVFHLHVHIVPRAEGDGLPLPWTADGRGRSAGAPPGASMAEASAIAHDGAVRRSERLRLADLFEEHAETLGGFARHPEQVVRLIAFMLRLDGDTPEIPVRHAWGGHLIDAADLHAADPRWHVECSGCGWSVDAPRSEALAAGKEHESLNPVSIR